MARCSERDAGPTRPRQRVEQVRSTIHDLGLDGIIVIGGNGSLTVAEILYREHGIPVLGYRRRSTTTSSAPTSPSASTRRCRSPPTRSTAFTPLQRAMTASWSSRSWAAIAVGSRRTPVSPAVPQWCWSRASLRHRSGVSTVGPATSQPGRYASIVVVAEGAVPGGGVPPHGLTLKLIDSDMQRLGGIGHIVADEIGRRTGFETRPVLLGHVQRGGTPTAFDRVLSTRFGVAAIDAVHAGAWGSMVALHGDEIVTVPLAEAAGRTFTPGRPRAVHRCRRDLLRLSLTPGPGWAAVDPDGADSRRSPGSRRSAAGPVVVAPSGRGQGNRCPSTVS